MPTLNRPHRQEQGLSLLMKSWRKKKKRKRSPLRKCPELRHQTRSLKKCLKISRSRSLTQRLSNKRNCVKPCLKVLSNPKHLPLRTCRTCLKNILWSPMSLLSSKWMALVKFKQMAKRSLMVQMRSSKLSADCFPRSIPSPSLFYKKWFRLRKNKYNKFPTRIGNLMRKFFNAVPVR